MSEPLDLEAIKARRAAIIGPGSIELMDVSLRIAESAADVPALVAEVERLRDENADLRHELTDARENY